MRTQTANSRGRWTLFVLPRALYLGLALMSAGTVGLQARAESLSGVGRIVEAPIGFHGVCIRYPWACSASSSGTVVDTKSKIALADRVNRKVNRQVREVSDRRQYKVQDYWSLPTRRGGDCEDMVLLKKLELIRHGVAPDRLLIATVADHRRRAHAVLLLDTEEGSLVLDNLSDRIEPWNKTGYAFIRVQDPRTESGWRLIAGKPSPSTHLGSIRH